MTDASDLQARLNALEQRLEQLENRRHIAAERIDVIEPDGRVRLVLSGAARAPSPIIDGRELERSGGNTSGIIFYNDEGDECGGLVFKGEAAGAEAMLAFDQFKGDQVIALNYWEADGKRNAGLTLWDHPDKTGVWGHERLGLGRGQDASVGLTLHDPQGRARLKVTVAADGTPSITLLDADGKVAVSLP